MKSVRIIPTVLANTKDEFDERLAKLLPSSNELQIDFMDGHFVQSTGVPPEDIPDLHRWSAWTFEAHIMVYHPERYIEELAEKGFKRIIFHYETVEDKRIADFAQHIRDNGMIPIMALNPETPVRRVVRYASTVDGILFLGVHPGFNGAPYVEETPARIEELVELTGGSRRFFIQVDGGMTPETIGAVVAAGADRINSGSFVSKADDPSAAIKLLRDASDTALAGSPTIVPAGVSLNKKSPGRRRNTRTTAASDVKMKKTKKSTNSKRTSAKSAIPIRKTTAKRNTRTAKTKTTRSRGGR